MLGRRYVNNNQRVGFPTPAPSGMSEPGCMGTRVAVEMPS